MHRWHTLFVTMCDWYSPEGQAHEAAWRKRRAKLAVSMLIGFAASSPPQRGRW